MMDDEDGPQREVATASAAPRAPLREWPAAALYLAAMVLEAAASTLAILASSALLFLRISGTTH